MASHGSLILPFETTASVPGPAPALVLPAPGTPGVVALFEPGHPLSDRTGIPSTGESYNDIAAAWTRITLGLPEAPRFGVTNTINNSQAQAMIEQTPKRGLHVASAHEDATNTPYQNLLISMGEERKAYVAARAAAGDKFYVSVYARLTRPAKAGSTAGTVSAGLRRSGGTLGDNLAVVGWAAGQPWSWPQGTERRTITTGTSTFNAVAGTGTGLWTSLSINLLSLGATNNGSLNMLPGEIEYRVTIFNLTAMNKTFAQVADIDQLEHNILTLRAGGRYYGDTWTSPTPRLK